MAYRTLDEKVEWEARRVAAALGVNEWTSKGDKTFEATQSPFIIVWQQGRRGICDIGVHNTRIGDAICWLSRRGHRDHWSLTRFQLFPEAEELMTRALYRLGIEEVEQWRLIQPLPPLSAHEKLELRKTMPREFWPPNWRDEEMRTHDSD